MYYVKQDINETATVDVHATTCRRLVSTRAYCTSENCIIKARLQFEKQGIEWGRYMRQNKQAGIPKDVKRSTIDCPDCGHVLVWRAQFKTFQCGHNSIS